MSTFEMFFGWPAGGIWSNIIASILTGATVWAWAHRKLGRLHQALTELREAHENTHTLVAQLHQAQIGGGPS